MRTRNHRFVLFGFILLLSIASMTEARMGGGRSSGSRGGRSFGTRSYQTTPNRAAPNQGYQQPYYNPSPQQPSPSRWGMGSGGFMRSLMGGMAGGFLGSMLFRSLGHAGIGMPGGGGMGLLEIALLAALGFIVYRLFVNRRNESNHPINMTPYEKLRSVEPGPYTSSPQSYPREESTEQTHAELLRRSDSSFDLVRFKDERMDDFLKLQSAWNHRDLSSISPLIAPELRAQLDADIQELRNNRRINKIENIAVRGTELIETWQEYGQEFTTLRFRANLIDYTIEETSGTVVTGSKEQPVKFEEDWTFVRSTNASPAANTWKLTAIEN